MLVARLISVALDLVAEGFNVEVGERFGLHIVAHAPPVLLLFVKSYCAPVQKLLSRFFGPLELTFVLVQYLVLGLHPVLRQNSWTGI